jgi:DNA-binding protein H-NS
MDIKQQLTNIPESKKTPLVKWLLEIVKQQDDYIQFLQKQNTELRERVSNLEKELRQIKKLKEKPIIKPSKLNENDKDKDNEGGKRPGSNKHSKKDIIIHEERSLEPDNLPTGAVFVREREFDVQEIVFGNHNIRFKIREFRLPDGTIVSGKLPQEFDSHFGPTMQTFINYQHYQCGVPQNLILEQMRELNVDISEGQINRILTKKR